MSKIKVIFLDIDGVLALMHRNRDEYGSLFHEDFVDNLKRIIDETGAKIVISSSWRTSGLKVMQEMWCKRNLPGEIIDTTPSVSGVKYYYTDREFEVQNSSSLPRGLEIKWWLKNKGFQRINWSKEKQLEYIEKCEVENYVILDDDSDFLYAQKEHFVKCSCQDVDDAIEGYGLTKEVADKSIEILNKSLIELYYE